MLQKLGRILGGDPHKKELQRLSSVVEQVNALETEYESLSDEALSAKTVEFRRQFKEGKELQDLLPEAFAAVREASKRTLGLRHYDVQLIGGSAIHEGKIVEMRTGEGKTLVATLPVYLNALTGRGVHLITVNDYLARRDARWMAPIYNLLGLRVGVLQTASRTESGRKGFLVNLEQTSPIEDQHQLEMVSRTEAYQADITYGTNHEFGFDYLRDNLTLRINERVQRGHYFAIIDEVDNVLIDEARTPLIISGPASDDTDTYNEMAKVVRQLRSEDYEINERDRSITLTEIGETHVEEILGVPLRDPDRPEDITPEQARLMGYLEQTLRAHFLYRRNKDYLVQGGRVIIVDEFTGRLMPGRRWSEGLHQAVEAKEGVKIEPENVTYATITLQNYFRMYEKLAGMTGTAITEEEEFSKIYKLNVLQLPTNLEYSASRENASLLALEGKDDQNYRYTYYARSDDPDKKPIYWKRKDYPDVVFRSEEAKIRAITREIIQFHVIGRPILIGTTSVEHSDRLAQRLEGKAIERLAQILCIRDAWLEQHNIDFSERAIPELESLNRPIPDINDGDLRKFIRELKIPFRPDEPENLDRLIRLLNLFQQHKPQLQKVLQYGIEHQVLNARKHDEESKIIAKAGAYAAVTIATNMAGRGVDIKLGGELSEEIDILSRVVDALLRAGFENAYDMNEKERRQALLKLTAENYEFRLKEQEAVNLFLDYTEKMEKVRELGGLHVIGSERHEARRIDNQLRGRAARQGDPGSSRFYLSLEDDLMRLFGGQQAEGLFKRLNVDENLPIEHNILGRLVEQSQERVEGSNFDIRKHLLEYDDVLNTQRKRIYDQRNRVFSKEDLTEDIMEMLVVEMQQRVPLAFADKEGPWKLLAFLDQIQPRIEYEDVFYPSFAQKLLLDEIIRTLDPKGETSVLQIQSDPALNPTQNLRNILLNLVKQILVSEREHLIRSANAMLDRTEHALKRQIEERIEIFDNFIDGMEDRLEEEETVRPQDLLDELSSLVHIPLKLSNNELHLLLEQDPGVIKSLRSQIERHLVNLAVMRSEGAINRRMENNAEFRLDSYQNMTWEEAWADAAEKIFQSMQDILDQRIAQFIDEKGSLVHDLDTALGELNFQNRPINNRDIAGLLRVLAEGTRIAFDPKSHRRATTRYTRLRYSFLTARLIESLDAKEITPRVLEHLQMAVVTLKQAWGKIEWNRLLQNGITLQQISDEWIKEQVNQLLGNERYNEIETASLDLLTAEEKTGVSDILGRRRLNENYRHLLLSVISEQWVEYLTRVEALRISIGMEAYAQRDPLVMYKTRATEMFTNLLAEIRMGVISRMFTHRGRVDSATSIDRGTSQVEEPKETSQTGDAEKKKKKKKRH